MPRRFRPCARPRTHEHRGSTADGGRLRASHRRSVLCRHGGDDLRVRHARHAGDGVDHGDGGLSPAGDHVDVALAEVAVEVHGRDHVRPRRRRREIDRADPRLVVARRVGEVHVCRGRFEDDVGELGPGEQPVDPAGRGLEPEVPGPAQPFALGVDPDDVAQLEGVGPEELVHEVGADVPGADDGDGRSRAHGVDPHKPCRHVHQTVAESGTAASSIAMRPGRRRRASRRSWCQLGSCLLSTCEP